MYSPDSDDLDFYDHTNDIILQFDNPHTIICGECNLVLDCNLDCENYLHVNNPMARNAVLSLCTNCDFIDP